MRKFGKETFQIKKNGAKKEKEKKRRERLQKRRFMRFGLLQSGKRRGELVGYVVRVETECPKALLACLSKIIA